MMLAGNGDVFHAGGFDERDPFCRIEFGRIELGRQLLVFTERDLVVVHDPFAFAQHAVDAPVNEEPEFSVLKPLSRFEILLRRLITRLSFRPLLSHTTHHERKQNQH